jgi:hypothetical protein
MLRARLILAWLLMAALPLQGFATVSMALCKERAQAQAAIQHEHHDEHQHAMATGHDAHHDESASQDSDSTHTCAVCAACCHVVAINELEYQLQVSSPPSAGSAEPFVLIHARPSPVPDKPPRA